MNRKGPHRPPDFIGIGFRRCASSWLHACLSEHPDIGKPMSGLHFFSDRECYSKGIDWYEKQLESYSVKRILGEFSVSYTYPDVYKHAATRIYENYPAVKLICTVRNPIERAYSDYLRSVSLSELDKNISFEQAIELDSDLIERGFYGRILKWYEDYFSGRVFVLLYEDLKANPYKFFK